MKQLDKNRIVHFINDILTADAVYNVLLETFLKRREGDIYHLAGQKLAIDFLREAWKELETYKIKNEEDKIKTQVGL